MRRVIDTAPKDGTFVILEDDVSGRFESAQWSADGRGWIQENGEPSEITPTHWQTMHLPKEGDEFILQDEFIPPKETGSIAPPASPGPRSFCFPSGLAERARVAELTRLVTNADPVNGVLAEARAAQSKQERGPTARRAIASIAAVMVGTSLIGWYFHAELGSYVTRYIGEEDNIRPGTAGLEAVKQETVPSQDLQKADSSARDPALRQQAGRAIAPPPRDTARGKQAAEAMQPEVQQSSEKERRRTEALANELARAQQVIEMQIAQANKARDQATLLGQAAESGIAELRQSLQKEHDRVEALAGELAKARRDLATQLALSSKASDEASQAKNAAETATAELRQSLKTEHDRAETLTGELARARRDLETQLALSTKAGDAAMHAKKATESARAELRQSLRKERDRAEAPALGREARPTHAAEAAPTEPAAVAEAQGGPEAARLLARASTLLGQGDISGARIVLEHAVETGSARASFMLAETYDPLVLSTWKTYGTRGDVTKARELYAKALAGGIQQAKDRSVALQ
ncbi:peptidoglycan hydrolase CwlO-like protein [Bradyrhizobium sp. USDA 4509]